MANQPTGNPYYPVDKNGNQSPTPAYMPDSRQVDLQQSQLAANAAKAQEAARKARQVGPKVKYTKRGW
ncbi:hypothetical protein [Ktedonospora formicarum]|uniref:Uncharacterized protein n=1 Tax=Ktedonospora formicarum TaxID=2778364 RepID=A0A8J3IE63_9CHLR|nr:hypothetical protein [Ktedonospora formicarum]GHO51500.1 hypothetical protein KSX_96630 [Ktedonospora formicarum]GHO51525.1 hypothetical protein KSX_96880 [Ktedonospora formicarum]